MTPEDFCLPELKGLFYSIEPELIEAANTWTFRFALLERMARKNIAYFVRYADADLFVRAIATAEATNVEVEDVAEEFERFLTKYSATRALDEFDEAARIIDESIKPGDSSELIQARILARRFLDVLEAANLPPDLKRLSVTKDDEIVFYFFGGGQLPSGAREKLVRLSCSAEGAHYAFEDRTTDHIEVNDVGEDDPALEQVVAHIQGLLS